MRSRRDGRKPGQSWSSWVTRGFSLPSNRYYASFQEETMAEEPRADSAPEDLRLSREEYDAGQVNNLDYEEELNCWYHYNYRGRDEKEWSAKVFLLGGVLACLMVLINIYMGLKTGWGEGGSIIAVLLAFLVLGSLVRIALIDSYGMLETNMIQTMASAGGTLGNLVNVVPALLLMGYAMEWYDMFGLVFITSFMGVFFAIPLRRQNVVIEKLKFPSGTACFQTIKAVHEKSPEAQLKARALAISGILTMIFTFSQNFMPKIKEWTSSVGTLRGQFFDWLTLPGSTALSPKKLLQDMDFRISWSPLLFGIGFMTGPRVGIGMLIGGIIGYVLLPDSLHAWGYIESFHRHEIRDWVMWPSTSLMVFASFVTLGYKMPVILRAFRGLKGKGSAAISELEVPRPVFISCLAAAVIAALIFMATRFEIPIYMGLSAIAFSFILAMIAVRAAGETDINPVGAMGHVTQIAYGALFGCTPRSNLGASGVTAAGASEAGDMMQDLKTGYLVGATPKRQVYIQLFGVFIGSIMAVLLLNLLLFDKDGSLTIREKTVKASVVAKEKKRQISYRLDERHLTDAAGLIAKLNTVSTPLAKHLSSKFSEKTRKNLLAYNNANVPETHLLHSLVAELNEELRGVCIYEKNRFAGVAIPAEIQKKIEANLQGEQLLQLNRRLLQLAFPGEIAPADDLVMREARYPAPAAHVWKALAIAMSGGSALIEKGDFLTPIALLNQFKKPENALPKYLVSQFTNHTRNLLADYDGMTMPSSAFQEVIADELNRIIRKTGLYEKQRFQKVQLRQETQELLKLDPQDERIVLLNRMLIEDAFPKAIKKSLLLSPDDFKDIGKLAVSMRTSQDAVAAYLYRQTSKETQELLARYSSKRPMSRKLQSLLIADINRTLGQSDLYEAKRFANIAINSEMRKKIETRPQGDQLLQVNRQLLQLAFPQEIAKPHEGLPKGAFWGVVIGAVIGLLLGLIEQTPLGKWMPSTIGLGISLIIPLSYSISIFLGSIAQFLTIKLNPKSRELVGPIAAGTIAGEPIVGTLANILP